MVLIMLLFISGFTQQSDILEQYDKQVKKTIKKVYKQEHHELKKIEQGFYEIITKESSLGYILLDEVAACHLGGCPSSVGLDLAKETSSIQGSEYFDVLVLLDKDKTILKIKILNYFSDYGYEVTSKKYLEKFQGKSICEFSSSTDGVDAISGATISSMALEGFLGLHCN